MASHGLSIGCRPEIRKACLWEVQLNLKEEVLAEPGLTAVFMEKPRVPDLSPGAPAYYLSMKVRSKLTDNELGFKKVALVMDGQDVLEVVNGAMTIKCKFNQRPRALFHKHSDVMILCVTLKKLADDRTLGYDESELIFRGGTGSLHSADSRKKHIFSEMAKMNPPATPSSVQPVYDLTTATPVIMAEPATEPLSREYLHSLRNLFDNSPEMNEFKGDMEMDILMRTDPQGLDSGLPPPPSSHGLPPAPSTMPQAWGANTEYFNTMPDNQFDGGMGFAESAYNEFASSSASVETVAIKPSRKRKDRADEYLSGLDIAAISVATATSPASSQLAQIVLPSAKRQRTAAATQMESGASDVQANQFQTMLFRSFGFMTLDEVRSLCQQSEVPFFIKDSDESFKWANRACCRFLLHSQEMETQNQSPNLDSNGQFGVKTDDEEANSAFPSFEAIAAQKCFLPGHSLTKVFTKLRDGRSVMVGALSMC